MAAIAADHACQPIPYCHKLHGGSRIIGNGKDEFGQQSRKQPTRPPTQPIALAQPDFT